MAPTNYATKVIAGVTVNDTPLIEAAQDYARAHLDDVTFNHVMRSWLFGAIISQRLQSKGHYGPAPQSPDMEAHALSALFHDLGWDKTGELVSKDRRFEIDSAMAARNWIKEQQQSGKTDGWDEGRLQLMWDAIALHSTPSIAAFKEPTVQLCSMGIAADFAGPDTDPSGTVTWAEFHAINKEFPRLDLAGEIRKIVLDICHTKPETTWANWMMGYGVKYIDGYIPSFEGKIPVDIIDASGERFDRPA